ncbi:hypothetical protein HQ524_00995 [Candidatus Uhrbacteria bacterium]|nr:hypothetical protein [Candidatus Uhrbacteria bacterium]
MKPLRFLAMFATYYVIGAIISWFFIFSANYLREPRLMFVGLLISFALLFLFSWLYFRNVRDISWKERVEAIVAWMGFLFICDSILLVYIYKASFSDLGMISVFGYGVTILTLFVTAYITSTEHPKLAHSPNLMDVPPTTNQPIEKQA